MKHVDYITVGLGIAATNFLLHLKHRGKTFVVFSKKMNSASAVSGGIINPINLSSLKPIPNFKDFIDYSSSWYKHLNKLYSTQIYLPINLYKVLGSIAEVNNWNSHENDGLLSNCPIDKNMSSKIIAPFGFGQFTQAALLNPKLLLSSFRTFLEARQLLLHDDFNHKKLIVNNGYFEYMGFRSKHIVFAEGNDVVKNPFFHDLGIKNNIGTYILIESKNLMLKSVIKNKFFLIPTSQKNIYKYGATYSYDSIQDYDEDSKMEWLKTNLKKILNCNFEVIGVETAIRATTKDKMPVVGKHDSIENMYIINGLSSRGLLTSPLATKCLFEYIECKKPIPSFLELNRFREKN